MQKTFFRGIKLGWVLIRVLWKSILLLKYFIFMVLIFIPIIIIKIIIIFIFFNKNIKNIKTKNKFLNGGCLRLM